MTKDLEVKDMKNAPIEVFFPHNPDSCRILLGMGMADYAASRIARAVEDADARLLNLNVTSLEVSGFQLVVSLRVDHRDPSAVCRSLERYGYAVVSTESTAMEQDEELRLRYEELMRYLSI